MSDQLFWLCEHGEAKMHYGCGHLTGIKHLCADSLCPGGHPVEGGEQVWYCTAHFNLGDEDYCTDLATVQPSCRMVERFLIPLPNTEGETDPVSRLRAGGALVIQRGSDGQWPRATAKPCHHFTYAEIFDALFEKGQQ